MMLPFPCWLITRATAWVTMNMPVRLTSSACRQVSRGKSSKAEDERTAPSALTLGSRAALLTSTSSLPQRVRMSSTAARTAAGSVMSTV